MKKTLTLIALIVGIASSIKAQDKWDIHKIDNHFSVKFPQEPKEITPGSIMAMSKDSIGCLLTIVDFTKVANIDSATLASIKDTPEFADQMKMGMQQSMKNITLRDFTLGSWQGLTTYTSGGMDEKKMKYEIYLIIYNTSAYAFSTLVRDGLKPDVATEYLHSIAFTK